MDRFRMLSRILFIPVALFLLTGCIFLSFARSGGSTVNMAPFKEMAKNAICADTRNRLFLIDNQYVFWDVSGNCADASYSQMLFGSSPDQVLCSYHDSIAGPKKDCQDEQYRAMFDTITANHDRPNLGLDDTHTVQLVP